MDNFVLSDCIVDYQTAIGDVRHLAQAYGFLSEFGDYRGCRFCGTAVGVPGRALR